MSKQEIANDREVATILAALRFWQANVDANDWERNMATDDGNFSALTNEEIEDLCERINFGAFSAF